SWPGCGSPPWSPSWPPPSRTGPAPWRPRVGCGSPTRGSSTIWWPCSSGLWLLYPESGTRTRKRCVGRPWSAAEETGHQAPAEQEEAGEAAGDHDERAGRALVGGLPQQHPDDDAADPHDEPGDDRCRRAP